MKRMNYNFNDLNELIPQYKQFQKKYAAYEKWSTQWYKDKYGYHPEQQGQAILEFVSEAGEVLSILTKTKRKSKIYGEDDGLMFDIPRDKIVDELGDAFWGMMGIMNTFDIDIRELIEYNINKLEERNK